MKTLAAKYRGYWNYYGLKGNSKSLGQFYWHSCRTLFRWLNRRSQKTSYTWRRFNRLLKRFGVPAPRIGDADGQPLAKPCRKASKPMSLLEEYLGTQPA